MILSKKICSYTFTYCLLALSLSDMGAVRAADLGGDCCNDLVERVAGVPFEQVYVLSNVLGISALDPAFENSLKWLAPKAHHAHVNNTLHSNVDFSNALLSCGVRDGDHVFSRENQCSWAKVSVNWLDQNATGDSPGLDSNGIAATVGAQFQLQGEWRLGFAADYEHTVSRQLDTLQSLNRIEGDRLSLGAILKNRWGALYGSLSLAGSHGWFDSERHVDIPGVGDRASSEQSVASVFSNARISYLFGTRDIYLKPMLGLSAQWLYLDNYTERGAGAANLSQYSTSKGFFSAAPSVELGGEISATNGTLWRPYLRAGFNIFDKDSMTIRTRYEADLSWGDSLSWDANFERLYGEVEAGLNVLTIEGANLKLSYEGRYGEHTRSHGGHLKLSVKF